MASSSLVLVTVCLVVAVGLVAAKPGFFPVSSQHRPHGGVHGGGGRQRLQEALEDEQIDQAR